MHLINRLAELKNTSWMYAKAKLKQQFPDLLVLRWGISTDLEYPQPPTDHDDDWVVLEINDDGLIADYYLYPAKKKIMPTTETTKKPDYVLKASTTQNEYQIGASFGLNVTFVNENGLAKVKEIAFRCDNRIISYTNLEELRKLASFLVHFLTAMEMPPTPLDPTDTLAINSGTRLLDIK